jgi:hypothetical protein
LARRVSMATRKELKEAVGARYKAVSGTGRTRILDEFVAVIRFLARHPQNDHVIAIGRSNWLFAGSLRAGKTRCSGDEPDPLGQAQWARSLRLSARHSGATAYTAGQSDWRTAVASLDAQRLTRRETAGTAVKMTSPRAYSAAQPTPCNSTIISNSHHVRPAQSAGWVRGGMRDAPSHAPLKTLLGRRLF